MATEVGSAVTLDIGPALGALDKLVAADAAFRVEQQKTAEAVRGAYSEGARAVVAFSDQLASAQAEARNAQAATRSAADAVRELVAANRDLKQARGTDSTTAEYARLTREIEKNNGRIKEAKQAINDNRTATEQERAAVLAVQEARRQEVNAVRLVSAANKDAAKAAKDEATAAAGGQAASSAAGQAGGALGGLGSILGKVGGAFAAFFAFNKLKQLGEDIIDTTSEFQRMEAVLTTINNGDNGKAQRQFAELRAFTLRNPFEVGQVTEAYVQLRNRGINPTTQQLQSLADLAAASGKNFEQVTEGLLGATTGQFRRLKEFGVTTRQEGDNVAFTFRGVTTTVQKSQEAIAAYVLGLGELNGVAGATERIMATTGGRITNLKDSFTELFATIGEGTTGPLNGFIAGLTKAITAIREALKSTDQKALDQVADTGALTNYGKVADQIFAQAAANAKKAGTDVAFAIGAAASQQANLLQNQLERAQTAVKNLPQDYTPAYVAKYTQQGEGLLDKSVIDRAEADRVATKARVATIQGEIAAVKERATAALKGDQDEADALGLIAALRAKISAEEKQREESKSRAEVHALNLQIIADNKELDALLEKQAKTRKANGDKLLAALRALEAERATLQSLAAKAAIKESDDAAARARLNFEEALRQADLLKQKLVEKELAVRKAGGRGSNADGQIDGAQEIALNQLRLAALDKYYTDLYKISEAREQRLFDLRADSVAKEVEAVDRKYDKLIAAAKDNIERQAIEEARQRDQLRLRFQQQTQASDNLANQAAADANVVGQTFGVGTGMGAIEAKRAEKKALLLIEQQHTKDVLNNSLLLGSEEGRLARTRAEAQLRDIKHALDEVEREKIAHAPEDFLYKLVLGENDSDATRAALDKVAGQVVSSFAQIVDAQQQAAAAQVNTSTQVITELTGQLAAQIQLNQEGSASNIQGLQKQITDEKAIRRQALEEQRTAAKEKVLIDTLTQASSIATAAAEVFAAFAAIPFAGVPLGIAAAGALIGAFAASKIQAFQAAGKIGAGFLRGGFTGEGPTQQEAGIVHRREFVHTAEQTDKYRAALFEPLHQGRPQDIDWAHPSLAPLLPDLALGDQLAAEKRAYVEHHYRLSAEPMRAELDRLHTRLEAIEGTNARMADKPDRVPLGDGRMVEVTENGSTHVKDFGPA